MGNKCFRSSKASMNFSPHFNCIIIEFFLCHIFDHRGPDAVLNRMEHSRLKCHDCQNCGLRVRGQKIFVGFMINLYRLISPSTRCIRSFHLSRWEIPRYRSITDKLYWNKIGWIKETLSMGLDVCNLLQT